MAAGKISSVVYLPKYTNTTASPAGTGTCPNTSTRTPGAVQGVGLTRRHGFSAAIACGCTRSKKIVAACAVIAAKRWKNVIIEHGTREEFKRCLLANVDSYRYPCGHIYIDEYLENDAGAWLGGMPINCPECASRQGIVTLYVYPPQVVDRISIQFTVTRNGVTFDP